MKTGYELLLPRGMTDYFEVVEVEEADKIIILHLEEKSLSPSEASGRTLISKGFYPAASLVTDGFHVQKLAVEALQEMRIAYCWEALDLENREMELAKETGNGYKPVQLENGDTHKQLLTRSRYLLFKAENKWTPSQRVRAEILFHYYPNLETAYKLTMQLKGIYEHTTDKKFALGRLARWYETVEQSAFKTFNTAKRSIAAHYTTIINYFDRRSINASSDTLSVTHKLTALIVILICNISVL